MECTPAVLMTEGVGHHLARRFGAAVESYSRVVELFPQCGEAWRLLGIVAFQTGDIAAARSLLERALRIDGRDAAAWSALGSVDEAQGNFDAAYRSFEAACAVDATDAAAVAGLTRVALRAGNAAQAVAHAQAAVARGIIDAGLMRALGAARLRLRDYSGAVEALLAALRIAPHADAYANLAAAHLHLHRINATLGACRAALRLDYSHAQATNNLGIALKIERAFPAALAAFERAVELGSEAAHVNLGTTRLLLGDYHGGWPEYGWMSAERRANPVCAALPMWDGRAAPGKRLLIWPEQGAGDTIQLARFLRRARTLVGSVTLACPAGTLDLLRTVGGVDAFIETRDRPALDAFDLWLPMIRLPVVFDVARDSIPVTPYLRADARRVRQFRSRLRAPGLRVGLVWSGNPEFAWNDIRSCGLAELAPLGGVPGVTWFALQMGAASAQQPRNGMQLVPVNATISDFADTAAMIAQLDLVVTVDTSVAHVAGALGRPAWVLLSNQPDWRWQLAGDVSPWYPTLRLFRQAAEGGWAPVVATVCAALRELASRFGGIGRF